jgi:hypothetical protein
MKIADGEQTEIHSKENEQRNVGNARAKSGNTCRESPVISKTAFTVQLIGR